METTNNISAASLLLENTLVPEQAEEIKRSSGALTDEYCKYLINKRVEKLDWNMIDDDEEQEGILNEEQCSDDKDYDGEDESDSSLHKLIIKGEVIPEEATKATYRTKA